MEPQYFDDLSTDLATMRAVADPFPASVESLATTLTGELQRLRYMLQWLQGSTYWYSQAAVPLTRGGTGAISAAAARTALDVYSTAETTGANQHWRPIFGLTLSNNGSDATNDIDIAVGECTSNDAARANRVAMVLAGGLTKKLDTAWAVGTNQGMLATGLAVANTTYHIFLIQRPDTGVVDVAADISATGINIAANTASAYTKKRRIGSIIRAAGANLAFDQKGDLFQLKAAVQDYNCTGADGTSAVLHTVTVPVDLKVRWLGYVFLGSTASSEAVYLSDPDLTDSACSGSNVTVFPPGSHQLMVPVDCVVDTSCRIRTRLAVGDANTAFSLNTRGWIDERAD